MIAQTDSRAAAAQQNLEKPTPPAGAGSCQGQELTPFVRWVFGLLTGCVLLVMLVTSTWLLQPEPEYLGKKLSEWEELYVRDAEGPAQSSDTPPCRAAVEAVRHMADEALPHALKLISYEKPEWKDRVMLVMERVNIRQWGSRWLSWLWRPFYDDPGAEGPVYFEMLGPAASPAVPELARLVNEAKSPLVVDRAMAALAHIGKDGLPPLLQVLADPEHTGGRSAALAIGNMKCQPAVVRAAVREAATNALQDIAPEVLENAGER